MRTWSCSKQFVILSGVLDLATESALYAVGVRRNIKPGSFRWSTYVDAPTAGDAAIRSREVLGGLYRPFGIEIMVTDSDNLLVREWTEQYCSTYCEHNAEGECACQPCVFIRTQASFAHEFGCPHAGEES